MAMHGMDVPAVRTVGNQLKGQAHEISRLISTIDGQVAHALQMWKGEDADRFREWWSTNERPALARMQHAIEGLGQSALNSARNQERISRH